MVRLWAWFLVGLGIATLIVPAIWGWGFYSQPVEKRVRMTVQQKEFRSGGAVGHMYGYIGTVLMLLNFLYIFRKRLGRRADWMGSMRAWMHFHVFVGLTGPILIFYHTAFVMRNLFAQVSFYSMLIVVITGVIGRFVYATIPRDIKGYSQGREELERELQASAAMIQQQLGEEQKLRQQLALWYPRPHLEGRNAVSLIGALFWERVSFGFRKRACRRRLMKEFSLDKEASFSLADQWLKSRKFMVVIEVLERHKRAFASWRNLHKSLTYVMLMTAIVHTFVATVGFGLL
ncbi:MAG: hypothetical protein EP343_07400 [Deltaproteobacteria bacterium]|nr:MAG: hypothetical protein EP343_07400 [Deltaproteobacteria bacterium]